MRPISLQLLYELLACSVACACNAGDAFDAPDCAEATSAPPRLQPFERGRRLEPAPAVPKRVEPNTSRMLTAASPSGLALVDVQSSEVVAAAATTYPVRDIAYDHWRDRWIVAEYDDASANLVSIWRAKEPSHGKATLEREAAFETGGDCRVVATEIGAIVIEDDGFRQHWMLTRDDLRSVRTTAAVPAPRGFAVRSGHGEATIIGPLVRDSIEGAQATLLSQRVLGSGWLSGQEHDLPGWMQSLSSMRACDAGARALLVGQLEAQTLTVAIVSDGAKVLRAPIQVSAAGATAIEDIALDPLTSTAYALLSGSGQIVSVQLTTKHTQRTGLPEGVSVGSSRVFSRMLALDADARRLLVANAYTVVALDLGDAEAASSSQPGREGRIETEDKPALRRVPKWTGDGLRWPVEAAISAERR